MVGYIYKTTNLINGKIYIGQHQSPQGEWDPTYFGSGKLLLEAFEKYGKQNFKCELIEKCSSLTELAAREIYWIAQLNSTTKSGNYNISDGGFVPRLTGEANYWYGKKRPAKTEAEKLNISQKLKGHPGYWKGKHHSQATKDKLSRLNAGKLISKDQRQAIKAHHIGSKMMNNGKVQKWVVKEDIQNYLIAGWQFGLLRRKSRDISGSRNPMYGKSANRGKVWIHNSTEKLLIKLEDLDKYINEGWSRGMK